jgi:hypothetical protein
MRIYFNFESSQHDSILFHCSKLQCHDCMMIVTFNSNSPLIVMIVSSTLNVTCLRSQLWHNYHVIGWFSIPRTAHFQNLLASHTTIHGTAWFSLPQWIITLVHVSPFCGHTCMPLSDRNYQLNLPGNITSWVNFHLVIGRGDLLTYLLWGWVRDGVWFHNDLEALIVHAQPLSTSDDYSSSLVMYRYFHLPY